MQSITLIDIPGAALAAFGITAALRWAYGDGPGSGRCRPWPLAALVVAIGAFVVWRILRMQDGALTIFDATAGILGGILIAGALKAAWADGPFERTPKGHENTPLIVMVFACVLAVTALWLGAVSLWNEPQLPSGGVHVDVLPPGNWE